MNLDIDFLINFMKKYSKPIRSEFSEQETAPAGGDTGGSSTSTSTFISIFIYYKNNLFF